MEAERFDWEQTEEKILESSVVDSLVAESGGRVFSASNLEVEVPLLWPAAKEGELARDWLARLPPEPEDHVVVLLQAGAAALGLWLDQEVVAHKVFKRYVVRGKGRAQPTHLEKKGKSRYGSRLRLQNHKRLLEEINERLHTWWSEQGAPARLFLSAPVRLWPQLWDVDPSPPFERDGRLEIRRIPLDVHVPDFAELMRVHRFLERGVIRALDRPVE